MYKRRMALLLLISSISIVFCFCHSTTDSSKKENIGTQSERGYEIVEVSETPLYPEQQILLEKHLSICKDEKNEIYKPVVIDVDHEDNIYIYDDADKKIKIFDYKGRFLRQFGREGKGPGDFDKVSSLKIINRNHILVFDIGKRQTMIFDPKGILISEWKWPNNSMNTAIFLITDSYYVSDCLNYGIKSRLYVNKYDFNGKKISSYGEFTPLPIKIFKEGKIPYPVFIPYSNQSFFAGCSKPQRLFHCLCNNYIIDIFYKNEQLSKKIIRSNYSRVPFTQQEKEAYFSQIKKVPYKNYYNLVKKVKLPKFKSIVKRLLTDDLGYLWVHTNERKKIEEKFYSGYDIFSPDGVYEAKVWLDIYPMLIKRKKLYTFEPDKETGEIYVTSYLFKRI